MEWMIVVVCLVVIAVCAVKVVRMGQNGAENADNGALDEDSTRHQADYETVQKQREREKEAHYMRNFWKYDGSEQRDWDEEV